MFAVYLKFFIIISFPRELKDSVDREPYIQFEYNNCLPDARILLLQDNKKRLPIALKNNILNADYLQLFNRDVYGMKENYSALSSSRIYKKYLLVKILRV